MNKYTKIIIKTNYTKIRELKTKDVPLIKIIDERRKLFKIKRNFTKIKKYILENQEKLFSKTMKYILNKNCNLFDNLINPLFKKIDLDSHSI